MTYLCGILAWLIMVYTFEWSRGKHFDKTGWRGAVYFTFLVLSFAAFFFSAIFLASVKT